MSRPAALLILLVSSAAAAVDPTPSCRSDADCEVGTFAGCCPGCGCPPQPEAISGAELRAARARCAVTDCAARRCTAVPRCPAPQNPAGLRAVCRSGSCQLEQASECRTNDDCAISYPTPPCANPGDCGCCPGSEPKASSTMNRPPSPPAQPASKPKAPVKLGLSIAECQPCPREIPAAAACIAGRCTVVVQPARPR